ncbi:hypothetical protein B0H14DRAFT_2583313 [Mycena olivaceomarginata]|nr:hypothetical protein B0H14DRAFT_2583313 [Mycena olivaceomarginata]
MYNLQRLYARLYMASATSASIYEQGWAFDEASINVDIIGHSTYHRLRHAKAFRFTYLQPRPIMYWNQLDPMGLGKGLTEVAEMWRIFGPTMIMGFNGVPAIWQMKHSLYSRSPDFWGFFHAL